jgi:copper chaperone CopZ
MDLHRIVLENITEQDAQNIQNKISSLPGVSNVKLIPMINSETIPLYSYAMKNIFKVNVNSDGKTDQQVLDEINKQLEDAGYKGAKVSYANIDGKKRLVINEPGNIKPGSNLEINVDGGNTKDVLKIRNFGLDPFVGMTDEEIRNEVKKENPGIEDKDIGIERIIGENGKEEVKVSIEKDEEIRK